MSRPRPNAQRAETPSTRLLVFMDGERVQAFAVCDTHSEAQPAAAYSDPIPEEIRERPPCYFCLHPIVSPFQELAPGPCPRCGTFAVERLPPHAAVDGVWACAKRGCNLIRRELDQWLPEGVAPPAHPKTSGAHAFRSGIGRHCAACGRAKSNPVHREVTGG